MRFSPSKLSYSDAAPGTDPLSQAILAQGGTLTSESAQDQLLGLNKAAAASLTAVTTAAKSRAGEIAVAVACGAVVIGGLFYFTRRS